MLPTVTGRAIAADRRNPESGDTGARGRAGNGRGWVVPSELIYQHMSSGSLARRNMFTDHVLVSFIPRCQH